MTRIPCWAILLPLCVALAAAPSGCANRSSSSAPRPDPNLASSSPPPAGRAATYTRPAALPSWSDSMNKGREDLRVGRLEAAEESFLAALEATRSMRPSDVRIEATISNLERVAVAYRKAKRRDDFTRVAELVVAESPPPAARPELAQLLVGLGKLQLENDQPDEAVASFQRALDIRIQLQGREARSVVIVHLLLARAETDRGDLGAASQQLERAIEIQEDTGRTETEVFVEALVELAKLRNQQGREDEARSTLSRALEIAQLLELERAADIEAQLVVLQQEEDPWATE